jgi:NADH:ubiquinone oxidoreductase subunit E
MGRLKVKVCVGTNCCYSGGESLIEMLESDEALADFVEIEAVRCVDKACDGGRQSPVVIVGEKSFLRATPEIVMEAIENHVLAGITNLPRNEEAGHA